MSGKTRADRSSRSNEAESRPVVYTVGHSNRPLDEFVELLHAHHVAQVVDVRKMPRSASQPQFNFETLPKALAKSGIGYRHLAGLGGLRRGKSDSPNGGWRNPSFQAYADHMQTEEFDLGLAVLVKLAVERPVAVMCAEAVPWRCHRSLIADAMVVRAFMVLDILSPTRCQPHVLTPWAKVEGTRITYPPEAIECEPHS